MDRGLIFIALVVAVQSVDLDTCFDVAASHRSCCKYGLNEKDENLFRECLKELGDAYLCDYDMCYGEKKGYITFNKTLNRSVLEESLLKEFENSTEMFNYVSEKCLTGDIIASIQEDNCNLREIGLCVNLYTMMKCDKWIDNDKCKNIKTTIEECAEIAP